MARLLSVNVGLPGGVEWRGHTVHTAIWNNPVRGRCRVGRLNLDGDGQGDLAGHGGEQRAVFVYQIESYRYWQQQLKRTDFVHGQFGENFTIEGLQDDTVCIGDRYQIGSALFEVTQPRVTCYRVGIRMNEPRMPALLTSSGRPGFYFRVLQEGEVGAGDEIVRVGEAKERMAVAEINALIYSPNHPRDLLERALQIEALSRGWRSSFEALLRSPTSGNAGLGRAAGGSAQRGNWFNTRSGDAALAGSSSVENGSEPMTPGIVDRAMRIPHPPENDANTGPMVSFARSGVPTGKESAYQSILELAEACDVPVRWSCRTGVCHSCESGLVSGEGVYGPEPLDSPADGNVLVCCSWPARDVVIDL